MNHSPHSSVMSGSLRTLDPGLRALGAGPGRERPFDDYDLDIAAKVQFVGMIQWSVIGAALNNALEGRAGERLGMTEEEVMNESLPFMKVIMESGRYPRLVEYIHDAEHVSEKDEVMRNVELILDGIAARLP
jgi:hypothetical protein